MDKSLSFNTTDKLYNFTVACNISIGSFITGQAITDLNVILSNQNYLFQKEMNQIKTDLIGEVMLTIIIPLGMMIGVFLGAQLSKVYGRRKAMLISDVVQLLSTGVEVVYANVFLFCFGRLVKGISLGSIFVILPIYLGEISPKYLRGMTLSTIQIMMELGQFIPQIMCIPQANDNCTGECTSNNELQGYRYWRIVVASPCILVLWQMVFLQWICPQDSPQWLMRNERQLEAKKVVRILHGSSYDMNTFQDMMEMYSFNKMNDGYVFKLGAKSDDDIEKNICDQFTKNKYRQRTWMGIALAMGQQMCGINILYFQSNRWFQSFYDDQIFSKSSINTHSVRSENQNIFDNDPYTTPIMLTIVFGIVGFVSSIISLFLTHFIGRRTQLFYSTILLSLITVVLIIFDQILENSKIIMDSNDVLVLFAFFQRIVYELGQGSILQIFLGEVLPVNSISISMFVNCFFTMIMGSLAQATPFYISLSICLIFNFINMFIVYKQMIETKGKQLNQIISEYTITNSNSLLQ